MTSTSSLSYSDTFPPDRSPRIGSSCNIQLTHYYSIHPPPLRKGIISITKRMEYSYQRPGTALIFFLRKKNSGFRSALLLSRTPTISWLAHNIFIRIYLFIYFLEKLMANYFRMVTQCFNVDGADINSMTTWMD